MRPAGAFPIAQSALFNFQSLLLVILLLICTCTYMRAVAPRLIDRNKEGYVAHPPRISDSLVPCRHHILFYLVGWSLVEAQGLRRHPYLPQITFSSFATLRLYICFHPSESAGYTDANTPPGIQLSRSVLDVRPHRYVIRPWFRNLDEPDRAQSPQENVCRRMSR